MATLFKPTDDRPLHANVAHSILADFRSGRPVDRARLRSLFEARTGRTDASGAWSMRQAYDALELAQALFLLDADCPLAARERRARRWRGSSEFVGALPVQSYRSEAQVALQQFSTPLGARLPGRPRRRSRRGATSCSSLRPATACSPGGRRGRAAACFSTRRDEDRLAGLAEAFPEGAMSGHDAELIDDLLPASQSPSLVLMNPPFARSDGRGEDRHAGARHLLASLARLSPGGRLVAIMPESFSAAGSGRELRARACRVAQLRLDVLIAPGAFARHGTGVAVRLVVSTRSPPRPSSPSAAGSKGSRPCLP